jgi:adenine/guanine phosphoribosyltransferase-like PRPP-binding protein
VTTSNPEKVALKLPTIARRLKAMQLPEVDAVVGIARGGLMPATFLAYQLEVPLELVALNYRADDNRPRFEAPRLLGEAPRLPSRQRLLLVDDVSVSGKTLELAREILKGHTLHTFVLKGKADHVAFPEIASCVAWPWQL